MKGGARAPPAWRHATWQQPGRNYLHGARRRPAMKSNRTFAVPGRALIAGAFGASLLAFAAPDAEACCPGFNQQCGGSKSVWCVQSTAPAGTLPPSFCPYGDQVVTEL